jgi:nucleotide-binding universal stress UspA family protein
MNTKLAGPSAMPSVGRHSIFRRVVVGIDGSPEGIEAARQAALLCDGEVTLVAAWELAPPIIGGTGTRVPYYLDEDLQQRQAERALQQVRAEIDTLASVPGRAAQGFAWDVLIKEAELTRGTLVAVGNHGVGRMRGIVVGSTATEIIHKAPCSVLVARAASERFPTRIVVGIDGSPESAAAYAAARYLAQRFEAELWPVVAHGGKGVDERAIPNIVDYRHEDSPDEPVTALVAAAAEADLVVLGSRGLHGLTALGSVSERVAHRARCSTLIVRERD